MRYNNYFFLVLDIETSTLFNDLQEPTAVWLTYGYCINSNGNNAGGWASSDMKEFCNSRIYNAFPTIWRSLIKEPYINANNGEPSYTVAKDTNKDYIYLPSSFELNTKKEREVKLIELFGRVRKIWINTRTIRRMFEYNC